MPKLRLGSVSCRIRGERGKNLITAQHRYTIILLETLRELNTSNLNLLRIQIFGKALIKYKKCGKTSIIQGLIIRISETKRKTFFKAS